LCCDAVLLLQTIGESGAYDPRPRPWYVTASSGPKDVITIVDKSGSMLEGGRWTLAKEAIIVVIQGLTTNDFIGIVAFSSVGRVLGDRTALIRVSAEV
jgi:von Willebrand factor type A domain